MKILTEFQVDTVDSRRAYVPGDVIRGELYISLDKPVSLQSIKVYFYGEGAGTWLLQSSSRTAENVDTSGKDKKVLVDIGLLVFGYANSSDDKRCDTHEYGRYVYTFEFNIPKDLPPSFKSPVESDLGYVKYYLMAVLSRPKKKDRTTRQTIIVNELIDPDQPHLQFQPGSYQETNVSTACVSNGKLNMESYLNRSSYVQGENILINTIAENDSSKVMKEIYAKLIRRVRCKSRFSVNTYSSEEAVIHGERVPAKDSIIWKNEKMTVPTVGSTICGNEHDIRVDYIVRVGMYEDMGSEIHLDLPVAIGTLFEKETDELERDKKEQIEDELFSREKDKYSLQMIKANERGKYRKALKEKISNDPVLKSGLDNLNQNGESVFDMLDAGLSNKENVFDNEINIALSEDDGMENLRTNLPQAAEILPSVDSTSKRGSYTKDQTKPLHGVKRKKTSSLSPVRNAKGLSDVATVKASKFRRPGSKKSLQEYKKPKNKEKSNDGRLPSPETYSSQPARTDDSFMNDHDHYLVTIPGSHLLTITPTRKGAIKDEEVAMVPQKFENLQEDMLVSQSEDQVLAGVDEEAFLEAIGNEIHGKNPASKGRSIEESPIIPSQKTDEHASINEEDFLKEFEEMEKAFDAEDLFQADQITPREDTEEEEEEEEEEENKEKEEEEEGNINATAKSESEISQQTSHKDSGENSQSRHNNKQENPKTTSEALVSEQNDFDNSQSQINPWGIVGMIGRLLGKRKKQEQNKVPGEEKKEETLAKHYSSPHVQDKKKEELPKTAYQKELGNPRPQVEGDFKSDISAEVCEDNSKPSGLYQGESLKYQDGVPAVDSSSIQVPEETGAYEKMSVDPEVNEFIQKCTDESDSLSGAEDSFDKRNVEEDGYADLPNRDNDEHKSTKKEQVKPKASSVKQYDSGDSNKTDPILSTHELIDDGRKFPEHVDIPATSMCAADKHAQLPDEQKSSNTKEDGRKGKSTKLNERSKDLTDKGDKDKIERVIKPKRNLGKKTKLKRKENRKSTSLPLKRNTPTKGKIKPKESPYSADPFFSSHSSSESDTSSPKIRLSKTDANRPIEKDPAPGMKKLEKLNDGQLANPSSGTAVQQLKMAKGPAVYPKPLNRELSGGCTKKQKSIPDAQMRISPLNKPYLSDKINIPKDLSRPKRKKTAKHTPNTAPGLEGEKRIKRKDIHSKVDDEFKLTPKDTPKKKSECRDKIKGGKGTDKKSKDAGEMKWTCSRSAPAKRHRSEEKKGVSSVPENLVPLRRRSTSPQRSEKLSKTAPDWKKIYGSPRIQYSTIPMSRSFDTEGLEISKKHSLEEGVLRSDKQSHLPTSYNRKQLDEIGNRENALQYTANKTIIPTGKEERRSEIYHRLPQKKNITPRVVDYDNKGYPLTVQIASECIVSKEVNSHKRSDQSKREREIISKLPTKTPKKQLLSKSAPSKIKCTSGNSVPASSSSPYKSAYVSPYRQQLKSTKSNVPNPTSLSVKVRRNKEEKAKAFKIPQEVLEMEKQLKEGKPTSNSDSVQVDAKEGAVGRPLYYTEEYRGKPIGLSKWKNDYIKEKHVLKPESSFGIQSTETDCMLAVATTSQPNKAMNVLTKKSQGKQPSLYSTRSLTVTTIRSNGKLSSITKNKEEFSKRLSNEPRMNQSVQVTRERILPYVGYIERLDQSRSHEDINDLLDELSQPNEEAMRKHKYSFNPPYATERSVQEESGGSMVEFCETEIPLQLVKEDDIVTDKEICRGRNVNTQYKDILQVKEDDILAVTEAWCGNSGNTQYEEYITGSLDLPVVPDKEVKEDGILPSDNLILPTICETENNNEINGKDLLPTTCEVQIDDEGNNHVLPTTSQLQAGVSDVVEQNFDNAHWCENKPRQTVQRADRIIIPVNYFPITRSQSPSKHSRKRMSDNADVKQRNERIKTRPRSVSPKKPTKTFSQSRSRSLSPPKCAKSLAKRKTTQSHSKFDKEALKSSPLGIACSRYTSAAVKQNSESCEIETKCRNGNPLNSNFGTKDQMSQSKIFDPNSSLNLSHDDKMVLGGGLVFNSQKKSLKSPRSKKKTSSEPYYKKSRINDHLLEKENESNSNIRSKCFPPRSRPRNLIVNDNCGGYAQTSDNRITENFLQERHQIETTESLNTVSETGKSRNKAPNSVVFNILVHELRSSKTKGKGFSGCSKQSQIKFKKPLTPQSSMHQKDSRAQIKQYLSPEQVEVTRNPPKSVIHPSSRISHNTMYEERHDWFQGVPEVEESRQTSYKLHKRTKDDSCDSFEFHEKDFGIIDQHGKLIIQNSSTVGNSENLNSQKSKECRKMVGSLLDDLMLIKHKRQASCPAAIGERESLFEFIGEKEDDKMDITEISASGEQNNKASFVGCHGNTSKQNYSSVKRYKSPTRINENKYTKLGQFGYEEEVIETYQFIEERKKR